MFQSLDFIYLPSRDVASEVAYFTEAVDATLVFAIEAFDTRVAMLELTSGPRLLLAGHLEGDAPVLVYRVENLEQTLGELQRRGTEIAARFGIPHGPGAELSLPGPQRIAVYELTRPEVPARLVGRRDF